MLWMLLITSHTKRVRKSGGPGKKSWTGGERGGDDAEGKKINIYIFQQQEKQKQEDWFILIHRQAT